MPTVPSCVLVASVLTLASIPARAGELTASDGAANDYFSYSVSLSGSTALVGAWLDDSGQGSAYGFTGVDAGSPVQHKLTASDGAAGDNFGVSVSLSGSTALVGALGDDDMGNDSGSAYLFTGLDASTGTALTETVKLTASDGAANDRFGNSVAIDGDRFLIGAYGKNSYRGKAYTGTALQPHHTGCRRRNAHHLRH